MNVRLQFMGISLLLCLALLCTIFAATSTVQAYQQFEQNHQRIMTGDVSTISTWMTLPYVARMYHVPDACLYTSLHIHSPELRRYATLGFISNYYHEPAERLVHAVQQTILEYRARRITCGTPSLALSAGRWGL